MEKFLHSDGFDEAMGGGVDDDASASVSAELVLFFIFIGLFDINIGNVCRVIFCVRRVSARLNLKVT